LKFCPECKHANQLDFRFCEECGHQFMEKVPEPEPAEPLPPEPEPKPAASPPLREPDPEPAAPRMATLPGALPPQSSQQPQPPQTVYVYPAPPQPAKPKTTWALRAVKFVFGSVIGFALSITGQFLIKILQ
jgi:hypothetical protein